MLIRRLVQTWLYNEDSVNGSKDSDNNEQIVKKKKKKRLDI